MSRSASSSYLFVGFVMLLAALPGVASAQLLPDAMGNLDLNGNGVIDVLLIGNSQFGFVPDPPMTGRAPK